MGCSTRNIPAHAGKTMPPGRERPFRPEHPRARGENNQSRLVWKILSGTSPRTRGKPWLAQVVAGRLRNIPAHAGKTPMMSLKTPAPVEHPRARGENDFPFGSGSMRNGTSPRTRGKPWYKHVTQFIDRNIPAHAGKTGAQDRRHSHHSEHPRARGENDGQMLRTWLPDGTSPRTRGKP